MADREIIRAEIERRMKCFKNERNTITKASDNNLSLGARIAMCEEILSFIDSMHEEPVSEELEKASKNYALNNTPWDDCKDEIQESFKAGAKWQKAKDESVTKDLEEYINELSKQFPEVSFAKLSRIAVRVAKWQEQKYIIHGGIKYISKFSME